MTPLTFRSGRMMIRINPRNVSNMSGLQIQLQYVRVSTESGDSRNGHKTLNFIDLY